MNQLKLRNIYELIVKLQQNMTLNEILDLPIYLGDDDELNGIHNGWYVQVIESKLEDDKDIVELINSNHGTTTLKDRGILIN